MSYTLIVIDMQPTFTSSKDPDVVAGVAREIIQAKMLKLPVLIVEYSGYGSTHNGLLNLLSNFSRKQKVRKYRDDGSANVASAIKKHKYYHKHLRVCGVNSNCCVEETVMGLTKKFPKSVIEVVKDACNTHSENFDWRSFYRHPNIKLV